MRLVLNGISADKKLFLWYLGLVVGVVWYKRKHIPKDKHYYIAL